MRSTFTTRAHEPSKPARGEHVRDAAAGARTSAEVVGRQPVLEPSFECRRCGAAAVRHVSSDRVPAPRARAPPVCGTRAHPAAVRTGRVEPRPVREVRGGGSEVALELLAGRRALEALLELVVALEALQRRRGRLRLAHALLHGAPDRRERRRDLDRGARCGGERRLDRRGVLSGARRRGSGSPSVPTSRSASAASRGRRATSAASPRRR